MNRRSKDDVLADIGSLVQDGTLTFEELQKVYNFNAPEKQQVKTMAPNSAASEGRAKTISNALYIVGTLIVCLGIVLLIGQNWELMNAPVRILVTLGLGVAVLASAAYRALGQTVQKTNTDLLTGSLFTIACVALTVGVGVVVTETGATLSEPRIAFGASLLVSGVFLALYVKLVRSVVLLASAIVLSVSAYFAGIEWLTQGMTKTTLFYSMDIVFAGVLLIVGGILFRSRVVASQLSRLLYAVGTLMTLGTFFWLTVAGGDDLFFSSETSTAVFDGLYPIILAGAVALSVYLSSRVILTLSAIFLTCYIFEISAEYFSDFLGGSVALCLAGVLVMGMAYGATRFAKRYIAPKPL